MLVDLFYRWYVLPLFKDYPPLRPLLMYGKLLTYLSGYLRAINILFLSDVLYIINTKNNPKRQNIYKQFFYSNVEKYLSAGFFL